MLSNAAPDQIEHDLVRNEFARVEDGLDSGCQLGPVLQVPADDPAHRDMYEVEPRGQHAALRGLSRPLRAYHDVLVQVDVTLAGSRPTN